MSVVVDEAAQQDSTALARSASAARTDAGRAPRRSVPSHVHVGHHRPPQGRHAHLQPISTGSARTTSSRWASAPHDRLLVAGPLYHVGAFDLPGMAVLWVGGTISILRDFDPAGALAAIAEQTG